MYQVALFIHIVGVMCLMGGHTLLHVGLGRMFRAHTVEQVREWTTILAGLDRFMPPITLAIVVAGIFMVFTTWGWATAWIDVSLTVFVVMMILGPVLLGRSFAALQKAAQASPSGAIPSALARRIRDRALWTSENTFTCLLLAILFVMTVKPNLVGTLLVVGVALIAGLLSTLHMRHAPLCVDLSSSTKDK
jgi:hypothetical protein